MNSKKIITTSIFLLLSYFSYAQVLIALLLGDKLNNGTMEFGLDGGINYSHISNMDSNKRLNTLNLGFYFDIRLKNQWFLHTGVLVKSNLGLKDLTEDDLDFLGTQTYETEGNYRQKLNYFLVPALAKYKFDNHMYAEIGPQFGLRYKAWVEFNSEEDGISSRIKEDNKDMTNPLDAGLALGAGYRFLDGFGWTIGVRYYQGFANVYKDRSGTRNSSLFLKVNIPIGISEGKKNKIDELKQRNKDNKAEDRKSVV